MSATLEWLQFVLAPQMINGLSIGVAVVLMALGLTIIFGLLDVINMAHGEFYAIGAYLAVVLLGLGLSFWAALVLAPLIMAVLGYLTERGLVQRVFHSRDRHTLTLLLTFGVAVVLEDLLKIVFGANPVRVESPITGATEMVGLFFPNYRLFVMLFGGALIAAVWLLVFRTSLGAVVRAAAFDRHMSASLGVPVARVYAGTFAFGAALAAMAGVLLAPIYSVFPTMGRDFVLIAFSVVIIGGMGSIKGAVLAGLLLTQVQSLSSLFISPVWSDPLLFGIMVLVLMWRPQGLFGKLGHA
ncbi:MAG: branched-chain amino acid ABC transporter permease [Hydrogenophaga sp.]|jgi:branched-chain amino acid transport system permease protein|uniref:branched-chain amino acid ABC transporter permease n=1 Tax=Hydrogenophaga sp. TaxID=1904254 RepID=UPI0027344AB6|nr:branched-chain amino acid ABC transporter permease [Hydrogenophaga sp.]MDP3348282.1 branched-chain amino acid ABC transporter permease [Hydrogenophaga sp.]MDZ4124468.1 branched-chain amino acid ABC transporter permease [Hydrogenophaga sp.]